MSTSELIPRTVLFGNPARTLIQISPDGATLAFLAPYKGVLNLWLAPSDNIDAAKRITDDAGRGIRFYLWAYTNRHLLYLQDQNGDENWHVYQIDLATLETTDLTPFDAVQAQLYPLSPRQPETALVGLNNRRAEWHDVYRLNLLSGALTLIEENNQYAEFVSDDEYRLRLASQMRPDGGIDLYHRDSSGWTPWSVIPAEDALTTSLIGLDNTDTLFMKDSRGRNTSAVLAHNLANQQATLLAEDPLADVQDVVRHPTEKHIQAVSFIRERKHWQILDQAIAEDMRYLQTVADGEMEIVSRALDDSVWVVLFNIDTGPTQFYLYDRQQQHARLLCVDRPELAAEPLVPMHSGVIKARDGLELTLYYSLPAGSDADGDGIPDKPLPLVFTPHGGPWLRDVWGFNPWHQWLANRGYAVLTVNFRSSTGFGKAFTNAGDREWGSGIMNDQIDAVQWAVAVGIADTQRLAIMGGSFGGYSTLAGLALYPELFVCGVDMFGPSNLLTLLEALPPYWQPMLEMFTTRVGDHRTADGQALLRAHSPLSHVENIGRPLLIGQGANDARVNQAESEQIVSALQARDIPVTYVLYPDEGHGFARPENSLSFYAIAEAFLAECLAGRYQPIGADFRGSSLDVRTGAAQVPGLPEALRRTA